MMRQCKLEQALTYQDLAAKLHVSVSHAQALVSGERQPGRKVADKIKSVFRIPTGHWDEPPEIVRVQIL